MRVSKTKVIYLDETKFTFGNFRAKGWEHDRDRIRIIDSNLRVTTLYVIAAISETHGLIDYVVHPKAINTELFLQSSIRSLRNSVVVTLHCSWTTQPECA